ncbi:MAG TPA: glutamyl-tRNA reductase, partial [Micromonosporaceae bacterium]|nr:glutamyl-tRNA reductase [Micromonosporaceae bacterium]
MNLLVVGASYRTAPVALLERLAVPQTDVPEILAALLAGQYVREAAVLSTCNRVEVYAATTAFHGGLSEIAGVLAERSGQAPHELASHVYVQYDADAVRHAYRVAAGLDSMVVGEAQILGQFR